MTTQLHQALHDTVELLVSLEADQATPEQALSHLGSLRARHPALGIDVAWQIAEHDQRRSFDALVRDGDRGTLTLSWCPERGVPFVMRGMQRAGQRELVRVDGTVLEIDEAMEALEFMWGSVRVLDRTIDTCLLKAAVTREPIELSDEELQRGVEAFRAARGLFTVEATERWLAERGLTEEMLERIVGDDLMLHAFRRRVTAGEIERLLREQPEQLDRVELFHFEVGDEAVTTRLAEDIRAGSVGFFEAAERVLAERAKSGKGGCACGSGIQLSHYLRCKLAFPHGSPGPGDTGQIVVMREGAKPFSIARVMRVTPATPESLDRDEAEELLFDRWLAEQRRGARVTWNFGGSATAA